MRGANGPAERAEGFTYLVEDIATHSRVYDRVEVHAGSGRRRRWTADQKGAIVAASFAPGVRASDVARRFDISPQHLFLWRRAARRGQLVLPCGDEVGFAAVVVDGALFSRSVVGLRWKLPERWFG